MSISVYLVMVYINIILTVCIYDIWFIFQYQVSTTVMDLVVMCKVKFLLPFETVRDLAVWHFESPDKYEVTVSRGQLAVCRTEISSAAVHASIRSRL